MPKNFRRLLCFLLAFLLFSVIAGEEVARGEDKSTEQIVEFLIGAVAGSHLTFIRNGEEHSCTEAAGHIRRKYDYFRSRIRTPEDFISLCASKSILSGKPYLVVTERGEITVKQWLEQKLADYMQGGEHS